MNRSLAPFDLLAACLLVVLSVPSATAEETRPEPENPIGVEGFQQLLPRGGIPAVTDPTFVPADEAEIPDDAWILGFVAGGRAFAYDLNLLNSHEVVNQSSGDADFAAVW